jgi:hypothetical protein
MGNLCGRVDMRDLVISVERPYRRETCDIPVLLCGTQSAQGSALRTMRHRLGRDPVHFDVESILNCR